MPLAGILAVLWCWQQVRGARGVGIATYPQLNECFNGSLGTAPFKLCRGFHCFLSYLPPPNRLLQSNIFTETTTKRKKVGEKWGHFYP
jgi:hypothetical protein